MKEKDILKSLQRGDSDAFTQLVDQYQHKVTNICYRFLHNKEDAQDVTQEVFLAVYKALGTFREEAKLSTWIYRIAVTRSLNYLKKRKRKACFEQVRDMLTFKEEAEFEGTSETTPARELEHQEQLRVLQLALDSLPKNQRTAFTLSQYDGVKYAEIAGIMEVTVSAVESLIFRARKNLQKKLSHYYDAQR